jgi:tetratricopeptide (TPR) repeat protein
LLTQAVSAGEQRLGPKFFERNKGHFWGLIETRAYMRARHQLAEALAKLERYGEAIGHFEALIALNPNDNQGVRYPLLGLYLTVEDLEGAGRLFSAYDEVQMTFFAWGRVIERFLAGELAAADEALKVAYSANRHVASLLIGNLPLPKRMPEMYQLGSKEEAAICLDMLEHALGEHPGILPWLLQRLPAPTISRAGRPGFRTPRQRGR